MGDRRATPGPAPTSKPLRPSLFERCDTGEPESWHVTRRRSYHDPTSGGVVSPDLDEVDEVDEVPFLAQ